MTFPFSLGKGMPLGVISVSSQLVKLVESGVPMKGTLTTQESAGEIGINCFTGRGGRVDLLVGLSQIGMFLTKERPRDHMS